LSVVANLFAFRSDTGFTGCGCKTGIAQPWLRLNAATPPSCRAAQNTGMVRDVSLSIEDVNSEPALVVRVGGRLESLFVFSVENAEITGIRVVRNRDKLTRIDRRLA